MLWFLLGWHAWNGYFSHGHFGAFMRAFCVAWRGRVLPKKAIMTEFRHHLAQNRYVMSVRVTLWNRHLRGNNPKLLEQSL